MTEVVNKETYVGRSIENLTETRFENDTWTVRITIVEKRTKDFETWDERKIEAMSTNKSEEVAFQEASQNILEILYQYEGALFKDEPAEIVEDTPDKVM